MAAPPKPNCPNFSSGPCAKRPGFSPATAYAGTPFGRSHRAAIGMGKIRESMELTREILKIPKDYLVAMVPASDTGAVEMMMWQLLGPRGVTCAHWESFGSGWYVLRPRWLHRYLCSSAPGRGAAPSCRFETAVRN